MHTGRSVKEKQAHRPRRPAREIFVYLYHKFMAPPPADGRVSGAEPYTGATRTSTSLLPSANQARATSASMKQTNEMVTASNQTATTRGCGRD